MHVVVERLSKYFGTSRTRALDELNLDVKPGQIVAVLGDNGAGKTRLLRCLATLYTPDRGEIRLDGERLERSRLDLRKRLAFLPDQLPQNPNLPALSYLHLVLKLYGRESDFSKFRQRTGPLPSLINDQAAPRSARFEESA